MSRLAALCLWFVLSLSWSNVQVPGHARAGTAPLAATIAQASSTTPASAAKAAIDGNRFATDPTHSWQGTPAERCWWWQVRFPQERTIGAILQIQGDHAAVFRNAPRHYLWQASLDGQAWQDLKETEVTNERRLFRIHRLSKPCQARFLRLSILKVEGTFPTLREVEFFADARAVIPFGDWIVAVDTTGESKVPRHGDAFIPLARSCKGWQGLQAQQLCHRDFDEAFVAAEPRPLCVFLSGNFKDWCQQHRADWRGTQEVLTKRNLPMWAACGGAQGLAILSEVGVDKPWDCPHCRDPKNPRLPIYTHIGHTGVKPCGDYSCCLFERGPHNVLQVADDPVFQGLPREFKTVESHCGQIEWPPKGWMLIASNGSGSQTKTQCLRVKNRYIYAAQFHIEMAGAPESSRQIMSNFLKLARDWGGYNPNGKAVVSPDLLSGAEQRR